MKSAVFALSMIAATAAVAQQPASPPPTPGPYIARPSGATVNSYDQAQGPHGVTQQGTVPGQGRTAPPGEAPPCTREITDGCLQTYERGLSPN